MSTIGAGILRRLTPGMQSEMPQWESSRPQLLQDWDQRYEQLKHESDPYLASGRLGWDDRIKMFHISGPVDIHGTTHAWMYHTYNQCRLMLQLQGSGGQHTTRLQQVTSSAPKPPVIVELPPEPESSESEYEEVEEAYHPPPQIVKKRVLKKKHVSRRSEQQQPRSPASSAGQGQQPEPDSGGGPTRWH